MDDELIAADLIALRRDYAALRDSHERLRQAVCEAEYAIRTGAPAGHLPELVAAVDDCREAGDLEPWEE